MLLGAGTWRAAGVGGGRATAGAEAS